MSASIEDRFKALAAATFEGIALTEAGRITDVNDQFLKIVGYTREELIGSEVAVLIPAEERKRVLWNIREGRESRIEHSVVRKDGTRIVVEAHGRTVDHEGRAVRYTAVRDISERKRDDARLLQLNRTLKAHNDVSHALISAEDEAAYLREVCRIVAEDCGHAMVWIGFAQQDEARSVLPVASAGFEQGYLKTLRLTWADTERGRGPTGTAIRTGRPSPCRDMYHDPRFAPWREEARKRGYASSLALPLVAQEKVLGAITLYSRAPDAFAEEEVELLERLAADVAQGITTLRLRQSHRVAEESLRRLHQRLQYHLQNTPLAVIEFDAELRVCAWSDGAQRVFGWPAAEVLGRPMWEIPWICEEDRGRVKRTSDGLTSGTTLRSVSPNRNLRKDGKAIWCEWYNSSLTDASGKMQSIQSLVLDVTHRVEAEAALRASEEQFRALADSIPNLAWWANGDGFITWYNRRWYEYTGTTPAQMEGWGWQKVHDPELLPKVLERWRNSLAAGEPFEMEFPLRGADGQFRWFLTRIIPVRDATGEVVRWFGTNTDISETREAREVLARSKQELERLVAERTAKLQELVGELEHFSYTITHDMRAPLRAMKAFGDVIVNELCVNCPQQEPKSFLKRIMISADRMDALIRDALSYSRSVRQELPLELVDAGALLRGMLNSYPELQPAKAHIQIEGELPVVMANEAGLTQCFSNLLGNAVKFVQPGKTPEIWIWSESRDGRIRIWVEDQGIGIPKGMLPRVFDMFSRGHNSYEGTGIGLALVRKVMDRMGGRVGVESEEGKGSRFWLELKQGKPGGMVGQRPTPSAPPSG